MLAPHLFIYGDWIARKFESSIWTGAGIPGPRKADVPNKNPIVLGREEGSSSKIMLTGGYILEGVGERK